MAEDPTGPLFRTPRGERRNQRGATARERAAVHFSVVGTCRHLSLDAAAYLREALPALHALGETVNAKSR